MSYKRALLLLFACSCLSTAQATAKDFAFVYVPHGSAHRLPPCPAGCEVRTFRRPGHFVGDITQKRAWSRLLHSMGARFPQGGFVLYEGATGVFRIASTPADLDAVTPLE